jgi:hypothetical protein
MRPGGVPPHHRLVSLGEHILHGDVQIRQCVEEHLPDGAKALGTMGVAAFHVSDGVGRQQLVDRLVVAIVPDLFEPAASQCCSLVSHGGSLRAAFYAAERSKMGGAT